MSRQFSEDVTSNYDGYEEWSHASTGLMSASVSTSPNVDNSFMQGWPADEIITSPLMSPSLSAYGTSAPASFPTLDLTETSSTHLAHDFDSLSHSVPHGHLSFDSQTSATLSFHQFEEQGEYQNFLPDIFYNTQDPAFIAHSLAQSPIHAELSHMPQAWIQSEAMARTNSAMTSTSAESGYSGRGFDDFYDVTNPEPNQGLQAGARVKIKQEEGATRRRSRSNVESVMGRGESSRTPKAMPVPHGRGRKGRLTEAQRAAAALIRKIGACELCHKRRAKCDLGIPCSACKRYFRNNPEGLKKHPCRGEEFNAITQQILAVNAFPKRAFERFLSDGFHIDSTEHEVSLDLGFGTAPFRARINLLRANNQHAYDHTHVEYLWPPVAGGSRSNERHDAVFPAILVDRVDNAAMIERHLSRLLDNRDQFKFFPLWRSELKVLKHIYKYYLSLPPRERNPLRQAFQLLILIHVGGDVRVVHDRYVEAIIQKHLPGSYAERVTPCYIRAQLGPIFSNIAFRLMRDVLKELELLSPMQDVTVYPMIISTFCVLFMAMESLQYHLDKVGFHSHHDNPQHLHEPPRPRDVSTFERSDILLRFYHSTNCHAELGFLGKSGALHRYNTIRSAGANSSADTDDAWTFMESLYGVLREARLYLQDKVQINPADARNDMSYFFDCLLAKMFVEDPTTTSSIGL